MEKTIGYLPINLKLENLKSLCGKEYCYNRVLIFFKHLICSSVNVVTKEIDVEQYQQIHHSFHWRIFGQAKCNDYIELLERNSLIQRIPYHYQSKLATRYRIHPEMFLVPFDEEFNCDTVIFKKIEITDKKAINAERKAKEERRRQIFNSVGLPEAKYLYTALQSLRIDVKNAVVHLPELNEPISNKSNGYTFADMIAEIDNRTIDYFSIDSYGKRVHTPFTSLKKEVRKYLYFESAPDEKILPIDVRSSQPWLTAILDANVVNTLTPELSVLIPIIQELHDDVDFEDYQNYCLGKKAEDIYVHFAGLLHNEYGPEWKEYLTKHYTLKSGKVRDKKNFRVMDDRDAAKICIFHTLYGTMRNGDPICEIFRKRWPGVYATFKKIKQIKIEGIKTKKGEYTNLCLLMQRLESAIINKYVTRKFIGNGITEWITVFDSIMVKESEYQLAYELICEAITELGIPLPMFHLENDIDFETPDPLDNYFDDSPIKDVNEDTLKRIQELKEPINWEPSNYLETKEPNTAQDTRTMIQKTIDDIFGSP